MQRPRTSIDSNPSVPYCVATLTKRDTVRPLVEVQVPCTRSEAACQPYGWFLQCWTRTHNLSTSASRVRLRHAEKTTGSDELPSILQKHQVFSPETAMSGSACASAMRLPSTGFGATPAHIHMSKNAAIDSFLASGGFWRSLEVPAVFQSGRDPSTHV